MSSEQKKDKLVLENLERIVSGEYLKDEAGLDKDTCAALELTREMTSWPQSPSKEFRAQLKARIIHRLAEQQKREASKRWFQAFWEMLPDHRWQLTVAAAIVLLVAVIIFLVVKAVQP